MHEISIKRNFILSTIYQILTMITPLLTAPYIARVLWADNVGIYSYTSSIQYYFAIFAALGTVSYGTREIARVRNNENKRSQLFWEIELLTVVTTLISLLLWIIVILTNIPYRICFVVLSLNIAAVMFDISWFYAGIEHFEHTVLQNSIFKILGVAAIFVFVKTETDLLKYIMILGLTTLFGNLSMWIYLPRYLVKVPWAEISIKRHFKETFVYFIPTIATSIYTVLDKTLIGLITKDNSQNGYYEQATKIINMTKTVCFVALNSVLGSRISYLFAEKRTEEIKKKIDSAIDYILFMGIGILFGLLGVSARFVPWFFGEGYDEVIYLLYILSPMALIIGVSNCLGANYYTPAGYRALSNKFLITGSVVNLVLNCLMIPNFKSYGAAFASVIAEITITILYMHKCNGYLTYKQLGTHCWKKLIAGIVMFGGITLTNSIIKDDMTAILINLLLGSAIYVSVLAILKDSGIKMGIKTISRKYKKGKMI